ncbi:hypothetical protein TGAMA5MH_09005 [Trichoderma gamsii]|uniref:Fungal lipase-type domain-containing protein n=1 Tax=Trichoderma gamsii TaxID=398673 RepID=A0A2K0SZT1_9HYPO|nr:hypothetical protein TGAMA5MH_09005 [Trichoderma gamsii]
MHTGPQSASGSSVISWLSNLSINIFAPSNYGLADLYYDATLIRVPYRTGVVWKWYTYWGTLVLEGSNWMRRCFVRPRQVAAGLIFRPDGGVMSGQSSPLVHLGFWALWASPEGFAGYGRDGNLKTLDMNNSQASQSPRQQRVGVSVIRSVLDEVEKAGSQKTEILIVGHSLGGAVSWYVSTDTRGYPDFLEND